MSGTETRTKSMLSALGNGLVWMALLVAVPGVIYGMTLVPEETPVPERPHSAATCSICHHYRSMRRVPAPISDANMILMAPGHPQADLGAE